MTHYLTVIESSPGFFDRSLRYDVYKGCDFVHDLTYLASFKENEDAKNYARWKSMDLGVEYRIEPEEPKKSKKKKEK